MSERQRNDFKRLFLGIDERLLFRAAMDGSLRDCPVRGLAWRYLLATLPAGVPLKRVSTLVDQTIAARREYMALREKHCIDPRTSGESLDISLANPLSQDANSPWSEFFEFEELREEIKRDLMRLHPGHDFFSGARVQETMERILFVWCKLHPNLSYRQGMHELLAPLYHVLETEAAEAAAAPGSQSEEQHERHEPGRAAASFAGAGQELGQLRQLRVMLDLGGAEADAYALFDRLMGQMGSWFEVGPRVVRASAGVRSPPATPLLRKCAHIQHVLLPKVDAPLHSRLLALE
eukprot:CAMPEP_0183343862 /NCGR_PEP_ID=MMETSP0164_2-20130417/9687_1 /TAXON_ID=221442 /ORGANISM="Coccolithus pelagicus ssp braarudi, Strain PLY182g" /LENGTH=291 /DNA_ID=CAMNT_0025514775 /DNA_START=45 /DNA_END=917 /DNA_ORIENTATION=-